MSILEWEDQIYEDRFIRSISKGKGQLTWEVSIWGGSIDNATYCLTVGQTLIIKVNIPSVDIAKKIAQELQYVLDDDDDMIFNQKYKYNKIYKWSAWLSTGGRTELPWKKWKDEE
jgi:hypothetical protein